MITDYHWYYDRASSTLYFPDGTEATTLSAGSGEPVKEAQEWAIGIVGDVGLGNLTDEQMMWLLSITMEMVVFGTPPN